MKKKTLALIPLGALLAATVGMSFAHAQSGLDPGTSPRTQRVNIAADGTEARGRLLGIDATPDGRYVAFGSTARNLVPGDDNHSYDVFVKDMVTGEVEIASVNSAGELGNGDSFQPAITPDGRYVAFGSVASNLGEDDTNGWQDIFVHDRQTGITERVSVSSDEQEGVAESFSPVISADGRYVVFGSNASNLTEVDNNEYLDLYLRDRQLGTTEMINVSSEEVQAEAYALSLHPQISADGRYVAFHSDAKNLVPNDKNGDDRNWVDDVFLRDRVEGTTTLISVSTSGKQGNSASSVPAMTPDARFIAFESLSTNLVRHDTNKSYDVFLHDREKGTTRRVSLSSRERQGNDVSWSPSISPDGRFVGFGSMASNLVRGDTNGDFDSYRRDMLKGRTIRVSVNTRGGQALGNRDWWKTIITTDGRYVFFESSASNLVRGDTNRREDVFMRGPFE